MARQATKSGNSNKGGKQARSASQKTEKYRFAQNVGGRGTVAEREYRNYASRDGGDPGGEPDVLLDVPVVKVDSIHFELDDLDAHLALQAKVLDLLNLNVGVDVHLGQVKLDIKGVEAQALVKVRLDHVAAIIDRVLTTLDRNPELMESLGKTVEDVGSGAGRALDETGDSLEEVGEGAGGAVQDVGKGAGQATGQLGQGVGQAVGDLGQGVGQTVGNLDQAVGGLGQAAGQAGQGVGEAAGGLGQGAGQAAGQLGQAAGGLTQGAGQLGQGGGQGQQPQGGGEQAGGGSAGGAAPGSIAAPGAGDLAKEAAKTVAREIGSAASDEAKELGVAATRKAKELGERRRHRRAERHNATEAAMKAAAELGVDLDSVEGTGAEGRITVKDVRQAQESGRRWRAMTLTRSSLPTSRSGRRPRPSACASSRRPTPGWTSAARPSEKRFQAASARTCRTR
jgi:pyruvate/2-oxoglutarate dehydrogenase complex dihydrolipoamide acyltransferase (E2) component